MSGGMSAVSRYRMLRGKSVSEARKVDEHFIGVPDNGNGFSSPVRTSTLGSTPWRKRSKTQGNFEAEGNFSDIKHFPVPPIPTPPTPLKEHSDASRPRAAVMPMPLSFGDPSSPTPIGKRQSNQALSSQFASSPKIAPVELDASDDGGHNEIKSQEDGNLMPRLEDIGRRRVEDEDPELLAQRLEAETDRILAEQKKLDLARLHQHLTTTSPSNTVTKPSSMRTPTRYPVLGRLGFLSRTRKSQVLLSPASSSTTASIDFARAPVMEPLLSPRTVTDQSPHLATPPLTPLSPMNNDRHIIVCYRGEYVSIPVKSDTSTVDILCQASETMTNPINISASIVLESWAPHGLERRLRRYERIRDVLDSWNHDAQSSLLILHSLGPTSDKDLDISSVPATEAPTPGLNLQLHHCTRPGRWHKRWITLLGDGLLVASKKTGVGPSDRDSQRLCHLSTYDIYNLLSKLSSNLEDGQRSSRGTPMKNLKPPKRYVFALKSQQKPTIYTDNSNFVHFFCTEDRDVAQEFHDRIHAWRSWYMVRSRKELQVRRQQLNDEIAGSQVQPKPKIRPEVELGEQSQPQMQATDPLLPHEPASPRDVSVPQITPVRHNPRKSVYEVRVSRGHKMRLSVDEAPYTIGAFQPLIDLNKFDKPIEEFGKDWIPTTERLSLLSMTPGTDSASEVTALTTPSSKGPFFFRRDDLDLASPSEERRRRRDHKKNVASGLAGGEADNESVSDSNINFHDGFLVEPETPPKPEPSPWLPSASEHTAKVREEQKRLDRLNNPILPPQRPVTSTGVTNHNNTHPVLSQERRSTRGARGAQRGQPVLPSNLVYHYKAATQWVEDSSSSKYLEVPGANHAMLRNMPSMPILIESATYGRSGLSPETPAVPVFWRDRSLSSAQRPSTSGKDQSAVLGHRPSTSDRNLSSTSSRRPSVTSDRSSPVFMSHSPSTSLGEKVGRSPHGRLGSGASLRRSFVGVGSPPGEELPPMPPVPSHLRALAREGRVDPGAGLGIRTPVAVPRSSTTMR